MEYKKTLSIATGIMLIAVALAIVPSAEAAPGHSIKGVLYIYDGQDTEIAPAGIDIEIEFGDGTEDTTSYEYDIYGDSTNYNIGFDHHDSELVQPGYFTVIYVVNQIPHELTPIDNESITIAAEPIGYIMDLTIDISDINNPPNTPILVSPTPSGVTGVGINADLSWSCSDPDGDPLTYDVYFENDDDTPDVLVSDDQSGTSFDPGTLSYSEDYYWQIVASDGEDTTSGPVWHFKTEAQPGGGSGPPGGGGPAPPPANFPPVADAGGPYVGTEGEGVTFDGSGSTDDKTIVKYEWHFGDGNTGSGVNPTHVYETAGTYPVTLTVTDNGDKQGTDTTTATIGQFNNPPTDPVVSGPQSGDVDTSYDFTAVSTDDDNDTIQYMIDWGDGTNTTTAFVDNGTEVTESHSWSSYGFKTVAVTAYDDQDGASGTTNHIVAIDVMWVKDIGYLIDTNSDGTYDSFFSNETGAQTATEKQTDGTYYINSDEDTGWDWIYDPETDTLTAYGAPSDAEEDYTWLYALIIVIILLLIIGGAAAGRRKKPEQKKGKPKNKK